MPRAVVAAEYGGPEVIRVIEIPAREPGPREVVIAVRAAALNPVDAKIAAGTRNPDPASLPVLLGFEASGVVTAVGENSVGADGVPIAVGDEVLAFRVPGAQVSELVAPAKDVLQKPATLGFPEAAGLLLVGTTAVHALETIGLRSGETVLVHGAAGSVGRAIVQLARRRGARVIGTASEHRHEELSALGAEPVAYGDGLLERIRALGGTVDASIDAIGTDEALNVSLALVPDVERVLTIVKGDRYLPLGAKYIGGGPGGTQGTELRDAARAELVRLAGAGELVIPVVRAFPLDDASAAYAFLAEGHAGGKVVLVP